MNYFGENLKALRLEHKYSQEYVAYKVDVSASTVSRWERTHDIPYTKTLLELSYLFEVPLNELLGIPESLLKTQELPQNRQRLFEAYAKALRHHKLDPERSGQWIGILAKELKTVAGEAAHV